MGRTKTYVGTQIARVIEDKRLPNSAKKGAITAVFTGGEIVDNILEELLTSVGVRAERLYDWAKNGNYVHGLPSGQFKIPGDTLLPVVKSVLDVVHGTPVTMNYAQYGPPNSLHIGWMALLASHGYDPVTNQLGNLSTTLGRDVYLDDMKVVVPLTMLETVEIQSLAQWGIAARSGYTPERTHITPATQELVVPSPIEVDVTYATEYLRVEYIWLDAAKVIQRDFFNIPVAGYNDQVDYFHASYTVGGLTKFWMYQAGAGTYPTLDHLFDAAGSTGGEFFPFMYFRYGKVSETANKTTESYKDNVKLLKYLGADYDQIAGGVDANPDIADVEQAMMMFAVPANTVDEGERRYLWEFFNRLFLAQDTSLRFRSEAQADIASSQLVGSQLQPPGIVIQDARFKMSLSNQGIYKIRKFGNVAAVGEHSSTMTTFDLITPMITTNYESGEITHYDKITPVTYHSFRRQITEGVYDELQVVELQTKFHILGEYSTIGDEADKILLVPLDHSITNDYSIPDREILYSRSLHFVFNSVTTIKLKWYQTGIFQAILLIVAIVITIYSWGADGGSAIAAALALGQYSLAMEMILTMVLKFVVAKYVFKLFVKAVGAEAAFVIAIVAALAGMTVALQSGGLAGAPWAQQLLSLSTGISQASSKQTQVDIADLANETSTFSKYVEEQMKLIDSAQDLLGRTDLLSPFVIFGEKPNDFYNRTVHSGNIGVVAIGAISSFVDLKLTLPSLDDSLGSGANWGDWKL